MESNLAHNEPAQHQIVIFSIIESSVGMAYLGETITLPAVCLSSLPFSWSFLLPLLVKQVLDCHDVQHSIQNQSSTDEILQWVRSSCRSNKVLPSPSWELFKERTDNLWATRPSTAYLEHDISTYQSCSLVVCCKLFPLQQISA